MDSASRKSWPRVVSLIAGVVVGVVAVLVIRVAYYEWAGLRPNMAPQMAYFFAPPLIVVLSGVAAFFEAALSRYWFTLRGSGPNFVLGLSYASMVAALIAPGVVWVFAVTNPFVVRWLLRRQTTNERSAV